MLKVHPPELLFGAIELDKTYNKLLTVTNEQATPQDFVIRPSSKERYSVYPSHINLPPKSSTTIQVQLRVEKFANVKKAQTKVPSDPSKDEGIEGPVEFPTVTDESDRLKLFEQFGVRSDHESRPVVEVEDSDSAHSSEESTHSRASIPLVAAPPTESNLEPESMPVALAEAGTDGSQESSLGTHGAHEEQTADVETVHHGRPPKQEVLDPAQSQSDHGVRHHESARLLAQISILEARLRDRDQQLSIYGHELVDFRTRCRRLENDNLRLRHQLNKTERKSAEQLQILSEHNSSTAEQDNFEAQVELGNKEARLTALEAEKSALENRVEELQTGMKLLRSVIFSRHSVITAHDTKYLNDSEDDESKAATAREHQIIANQSNLLLAVRRELVDKTAEFSRKLTDLEEAARTAKRQQHAAECELHWKSHNQDTRVRNLQALLNLKRDARTASPAQRLAAVALQLQQEQERGISLETQLNRAVLAKESAEEKASSAEARAENMMLENSALRLTLSCVGVGVHPSEAVAKLLKMLRHDVAKARKETSAANTATRATEVASHDSVAKSCENYSKDFYSSESLETFEDLVKNIMTIQVFDADTISKTLNSKSAEGSNPNSQLAVVNHSFLIACLRLVGSLRSAWRKEAQVQKHCTDIFAEAKRAENQFQTDLMQLQDSYKTICAHYQGVIDRQSVNAKKLEKQVALAENSTTGEDSDGDTSNNRCCFCVPPTNLNDAARGDKQKFNQVCRHNKELMEKNDELEMMLRGMQRTVSILQNAVASTETSNNIEADGVASDLHRKIVQLSRDLVNSHESCAQLRRRMSHISHELLETQNELAQAKGQHDSAQSQAEVLRRKLNEVEARNKTLEIEIESKSHVPRKDDLPILSRTLAKHSNKDQLMPTPSNGLLAEQNRDQFRRVESKLQQFDIPLVNAATAASILTGIQVEDGEDVPASTLNQTQEFLSTSEVAETIASLKSDFHSLRSICTTNAKMTKDMAELVSKWERRAVVAEDARLRLDVELRKTRMAYRALELQLASAQNENRRYIAQASGWEQQNQVLRRTNAILHLDACKLRFRLRAKLRALRTFPLSRALKMYGPKIVQMVSDSILEQLPQKAQSAAPASAKEVSSSAGTDATLAQSVAHLSEHWSSAFRFAHKLESQDGQSSLSSSPIPQSTVICLLQHLVGSIVQNYEFSLRFQQTLQYHDALMLFAAKPRVFQTRNRYLNEVAAFLGENGDPKFLKSKPPRIPPFPCAALNSSMLHDATQSLNRRQLELEIAEGILQQQLREQERRQLNRHPVGTQTAVSASTNEAVIVKRRSLDGATQTKSPTPLESKFTRLTRVVTGSIESVSRSLLHALEGRQKEVWGSQDNFTALDQALVAGVKLQLSKHQSADKFNKSLSHVTEILDFASTFVSEVASSTSLADNSELERAESRVGTVTTSNSDFCSCSNTSDSDESPSQSNEQQLRASTDTVIDALDSTGSSSGSQNDLQQSTVLAVSHLGSNSLSEIDDDAASHDFEDEERKSVGPMGTSSTSESSWEVQEMNSPRGVKARIKSLSAANRRKTKLLRDLHSRIDCMTRDLSDANKEKRRLVKVARQYAQDVKAKGNYASQLVQKLNHAKEKIAGLLSDNAKKATKIKEQSQKITDLRHQILPPWPPSQRDTAVTEPKSNDTRTQDQGTHSATPPPATPEKVGQTYVRKQLKAVIKRKDVAIQNLKNQVKSRDDKIREIQASFDTARVRFKRRTLKLEVDHSSELQRRHAEASKEAQNFKTRETDLVRSIKATVDALLAGNTILRNRVRDRIEPEFLDVSLEEDSIANVENVERTILSNSSSSHAESKSKQRQQKLFNQHAAVLGLHPHEVRKLLHPNHAQAEHSAGPAENSGVGDDAASHLHQLCEKIFGHADMTALTDPALMQHLLAEIVGERVRLQLLHNQFFSIKETKGGSESDESATLSALKATVYNYETILKEVKTQLVVEHAQRNEITKKYRALIAAQLSLESRQ